MWRNYLKIALRNFSKNRFFSLVNILGLSIGLAVAILLILYIRNEFSFDRFHGNRDRTLITSAIALFILVIACINFMNLSMAQSVRRIKEVGLRKVMGATQMELVWQFLSEAVLISLVAFLVALILIEIVQPFFNDIVEAQLGLYQRTNLALIPAIILLVVVQFFISVILIICTLVILGQMNFIKKRDLGFNKNGVVLIFLESKTSSEKAVILKNEFRQLPEVVAAGASGDYPGQGFTRNGYLPEGFKDPIMFYALDIDPDFLGVLGIPVVEGNGFSDVSEADAEAFLINQTLARELN